jgi:winged helix DNA-binding protein
MGAVQSQDYFGGLWAIALRLRPCSGEAAMEEAVAARTIVRTWPMRGTLHFVPAADVRWMLKLLTPRAIARSAGRYRELGLDTAAFAKSGKILARALRGGKALTRPEVYATLAKGGVSPEGQRGIHILGHLAQEGLLCFGARRARQPTFVLLDEWLPPAREPTRAAALAALAERYFASHGPATVQDFAWWTGLLVKDARAAIEAAAARLVKDSASGEAWRWAESPATSRDGKAPAAVLLPAWDEYIVAYQDRTHALGHLGENTRHALAMVGRPVVLVDGRVVGSWRRTLTARRARVIVEFWIPVTDSQRRAVDEAAARHGRFLGRTAEIEGGR